MADTAEKAETWVPAALLLRPQGRRGELLAEPQGDLDVFAPGRKLFLSKSENGPPLRTGEQVVEDVWQPTGKNAGRLVIKLVGIDSISAAEAIAKHYLILPSEELPPLEVDTYRVRDLVGCFLLDGDTLAGTIVDVQFPVGADGRTRLQDAADLLVVEPVAASDESERSEPVMVPFVRAWLVSVDLEARRITMHLPAGLFEVVDQRENASAEPVSPESPTTD